MKIQASKIKNQQNMELYSLHNRMGEGHPSSIVKKKSVDTNIEKRPAGDASFGGSVILQAPEWANKLVRKQGFNKAVDKCANMATIVEAILVLVLVSVVRPLVTLSMPAAEDKDKKMLAAKNIVSGVIGFGFAMLFFKPLSTATKKILDNPGKYIKKCPELVEKLTKTKNLADEAKYMENSKFRDDYRTVFNKGADVLISPIKSATTIGSVPLIMKLMFPEKNKNGKKEKVNLSDILNRSNNKVENKQVSVKGGQK